MILRTDFDLSQHNSYRIKSTCKRAFFPSCEEDFIRIYSENPDTEKVILGGGYNVILSKDYYDYDFILIGESFSKVEMISPTTIVGEAGADIQKISEYALENSLSGAEIFFDIPSSLGGAVVMNAGASGEEIKDILKKVRYLELKDMSINEIPVEEINFEYRNSFFQRNTDKIVLKVWLDLIKGDYETIKGKMLSVKEARWAKQPKELPNAGSVFKRPKGYYVGAIMEDLKLKGFTMGGAKISEKHGGFIVNFNNAKGQDILDIINHVKNKVVEAYGVDLEIEQRII